MDSEESVKGSQAAPTRAPLTDSSESGTIHPEGKGAGVSGGSPLAKYEAAPHARTSALPFWARPLLSRLSVIRGRTGIPR